MFNFFLLKVDKLNNNNKMFQIKFQIKYKIEVFLNYFYFGKFRGQKNIKIK